jgi:capsule polysaccharide export protein KpsE/RkpR
MSKGRMKREFLETQVAKHMADVDSLAKALRDFQTKNKSVALDQQTEAMVSMYGEIVAQYMQTDIEYELAKNQYSESSPIVQELAAKKALLSGKVKELENSNTTLTPDYLIQIDKIPDLSMQLAMLMVNVEIKKQIIEYLYPQFELAKLEELKDMPSFQIIDAPREAGMRSKPKRAILVVIITLAAFIFACVLALIVNGLQHNSGKVNQIWKTFWGKA